MVPLSLDPVCPCHLWILTALLVDSTEARDLTHSSLLTMFFFALDVIACTKNFSVLLVLPSLKKSTSQYYFVLQSLQELLPSTTLYIFVLQNLHKVLPSTTLYYKACTNALQNYFVLQGLHKILSSTTLCTTKLTQFTSQYYFVLQDLHKVLPNTTSIIFYLLLTTRLAQNTSQYSISPHSPCTRSLYTKVFTHRSFYTQKLSHWQRTLYAEKFLHRNCQTKNNRTDFEARFKGMLNRTSSAPKWSWTPMHVVLNLYVWWLLLVKKKCSIQRFCYLAQVIGSQKSNDVSINSLFQWEFQHPKMEVR